MSLRRADLTVALLLFVIGSVLGSLHHRGLLRHGGLPRTPPRAPAIALESAVLQACGRGFAHPAIRVGALERFLGLETDSFDCEALPADLRVAPPSPAAVKHRYLLGAVVATWLSRGTVSWKALSPLFGALFGSVIALSYLVFRLGMGRILAVVCSSLLLTSPLHLAHLSNLRDYSRGPFLVASLFLMGWMATRRLSSRGILGTAILSGAILGAGFGFRPDMPIMIPAFAATILFLQPGGPTDRTALNSAAVALFLGAFTLVGWPMIAERSESNRFFHVAVIGMTEDRLAGTGLESPLYSLGGVGPQKDNFADVTALAEYRRRHGGVAPPGSPSLDYYFALLRHFPADFLLRAGASAVRVSNLPFISPTRYWTLPNTGVDLPEQTHPLSVESPLLRRFYDSRARWLSKLDGAGPFLCVLCLLLIAATNRRLGGVALFLFVYFGSYPAIQFETRHVFHLEILGLWSLGVALQSAVELAKRLLLQRRRDSATTLRGGARLRLATPTRTLASSGLAALLLLGFWFLLRAVQARHIGSVFETVGHLEIEPMATLEEPGNGVVTLELPGLEIPEPHGLQTEYLVAKLRSRECDQSSVDLGVRYREPESIANRQFGTPWWDLSHDLSVPLPTGAGQTTSIVFPVYFGRSVNANFDHIELPREHRPCLADLSRLTRPEDLPLPFGLILRLPPDWEDLPRTLVPRASRSTAGEIDGLQSVPPGFEISLSELTQPLSALDTTRTIRHSEIVEVSSRGWTVRGRGRSRFSPLLELGGIEVDIGSAVVARGEVYSGGFVLAMVRGPLRDEEGIVVAKDRLLTSSFFERHHRLLDIARGPGWNDIETLAWKRPVLEATDADMYDRWQVLRVDRPGPFTLAFRLPPSTLHSLVLANSLDVPGANTDFVIREIGTLRTTSAAESALVGSSSIESDTAVVPTDSQPRS